MTQNFNRFIIGMIAVLIALTALGCAKTESIPETPQEVSKESDK